ncbi:MAG: alpha-L-fucosidase, partial [bacterium]|nr:alpha-L-fucosidase [bacterium]
MQQALVTILIISAILLANASPAAAQKYEANWESLDSRPTPSWFVDAKFGIFIHWGVYSVPSYAPKDMYSEWYWEALDGNPAKQNARRRRRGRMTKAFHNRVYGEDFEYTDFAPLFAAEMYDPAEWARIFADSGAKYVVLTSKHHDGFCLWQSREANRTWSRPWNSVDAGPRRDLLGELTTSVRKQGMKMGIYYSLYEWFNPLWLNDKPRYVTEHMFPQFKDVVRRYKPAVIFSDGEWDITDKEWRSPELLAWLFNEAPNKDEVVINDRWGKGLRHKHGGYFTTEYGAGMKDASHPWEENRGIGYSFGYNRNEPLSNYRTGQELVWILADLVSRGGNLLLDVGPTADGRVPVIMQDRLAEIGAWLRVNG